MTMADRTARDELARALRRLVADRITNDEFEDCLSSRVVRSRDLGVQSVHLAVRQLYDDLHEHRLKGRHAIGRVGRRRVAQWTLFLRSDLEYEWPNLVGWRGYVLALPNVVTFGAFGRIVRQWHDRRGQAAAWPFFRISDLQAAELAWLEGLRSRGDGNQPGPGQRLDQDRRLGMVPTLSGGRT